MASRLSVRPSVTLRYCDHIGWNSSKNFTADSPPADPTSWIYSTKGNTPHFIAGTGPDMENVAVHCTSCNISEMGQPGQGTWCSESYCWHYHNLWPWMVSKGDSRFFCTSRLFRNYFSSINQSINLFNVMRQYDRCEQQTKQCQRTPSMHVPKQKTHKTKIYCILCFVYSVLSEIRRIIALLIT